LPPLTEETVIGLSRLELEPVAISYIYVCVCMCVYVCVCVYCVPILYSRKQTSYFMGDLI